MIDLRFTDDLPEGFYGFADTVHNIVYVSRQLPINVQNFVIKHETRHTQQNCKYRLIREIDANMYAMWYYPLGGLKTLWKSITSWTRFKVYYNIVMGKYDYEKIAKSLLFKSQMK